VKTDLGFLHIIHRLKIVGRETNNNKGKIIEKPQISAIILLVRTLAGRTTPIN
jgi:hypothetical protein